MIFVSQNSAFCFGQVAWVGQPCQKQPSTKTARRCCGKTKSGRPGSGWPRRQPVILKTSGLKDPLAEALPSKGISFAFVFGSVAAGGERVESDVDLMIVGTATHRSLASALRLAGEQIGREINPNFWGTEELKQRVAAKDHFLRDVISKPKLLIRGAENEFNDLVGGGVAPAT